MSSVLNQDTYEIPYDWILIKVKTRIELKLVILRIPLLDADLLIQLCTTCMRIMIMNWYPGMPTYAGHENIKEVSDKVEFVKGDIADG